MLEEKKNKVDASNLAYEDKKKVYATSEFELTNKISNDEWNPEILKARQKKLADYAKAIWRINL